MRISGVRCDGCGKEHLVNPNLLIQSTRDFLPHDWFILSRGPYDAGEEPWIFCSKQCLRQHPLYGENRSED